MIRIGHTEQIVSEAEGFVEWSCSLRQQSFCNMNSLGLGRIACMMGAMPTEAGEPIILLAEDTENDVLMFQRAFRDYGVGSVVHVVPDGEQAIEYLKGTGKYANRAEYPLPTLLLLDLKMPRKNGFDVLEWVRQEPSLRGLLIVVLTTSDRISDIDRAYKLGANSFLTKPLDLGEFRVMIESLRKYWLTFNRPPTTTRPKNGHGNGTHRHTNGSAPK